jgi:hypothetical protein
MTKYVNIALEDEVLNKIEKQRSNISLDKCIVDKLKEPIILSVIRIPPGGEVL